VLLRRCSDIEGWDIDELASDADVTLSDQDTGVVDGLGETLLVDLGLEAAFQQLLGTQLEDEIELHLVVGKEPVSAHTSHQCGTLENSLWILWVQGEECAGSLTELGKSILNTPDFALAAKSVFSDELQFSIKTFLLVWATRSLGGLAVCRWSIRTPVRFSSV